MLNLAVRSVAAVAALLVGAIALSGCISTGPKNLDDAPDGVPSPVATEVAGFPALDDLIVRTADTELRLESLPEEAGYAGMPDDVGCGPDLSEPEITDLGRGWWKVANRSEADTYALWLQAGSGPGLPIGGTVGSSQAYVRWTTTTTFDVPATSSLDVTASPDGEGGSVELHLRDVTSPLTAVAATIALRGEGGGVDLQLAIPDWACDQPGDLTLFSRLSPSQMATLGEDGAVDYDVELVLDGTTYTASGSADGASSAEPTWTPGLP